MDIKAIVMGVAFALMWSSAFTSARMIVFDAPPLMALSLRFFLAGFIGIAIARALGQTWRLSRGQWRATIIFGICQNALYLGLNFVAMQKVEAGLASIIASSLPLMVAFAGWMFLGEKTRPLGLFGLGAGMFGVLLIMGSRLSGGVDVTGLILCLMGAAALTVATLTVRGASSGGNLLMVVGLQMLVGAVCLGVVSAAIETYGVNWSTRLVLAFAYTTLIPGLLATFVWFMLVDRIGTVRAATFHFLNPFLGVTIAALLLGEALGWVDVIGVAIITGGILAVQISKAQQKLTPIKQT
ncbi:DMT family transporter [Oceaniglobus ichthyenteri]|uniref:DMT family transporter n=1 Tax=Oceaniglobus ichthyenteri TaxID=2136177 RepID=UPI000D3AFA2F|nr:DMT family transporter [Oceaniglobus ichthyenteri]